MAGSLAYQCSRFQLRTQAFIWLHPFELHSLELLAGMRIAFIKRIQLVAFFYLLDPENCQMADASTSHTVAQWQGFKARQLPEVAPWVEKIGRAGYFAKGIVYFIIGFLAFKLALGVGGEITGARGAIKEIGQQSYGRLLLGLMAIGLFGYLTWRLVQAFKDTEGEGHDAKGIIKRIGFVISGISYGLLGVFAGSLALGMTGSGGSGSGSSTENAKQTLLQSTAGRYGLGIIGAIVIMVALYFVYKAIKAKFMEKYPIGSMSDTARKAALHIGRTGLTTRGIAFCIIGWFLLQSAINGASSGDVSGVSDALAVVAAQPYGKFLLGTAGFGLIAFAIHTMMLGWYRRFNIRT